MLEVLAVSACFFVETVSVRIVSAGTGAIGVTLETVSVLIVSEITLSVVTDVSVLFSFLQLRTMTPMSRIDIINFIIVYFVVMVQK